MKIIVCVDTKNGMMFNNRRQSQDKILRQRVMKLVGENKLWMNAYTGEQFSDYCDKIIVDENFLEKAEENDFCFVENNVLDKYAHKITCVILYKWNRLYPSDCILTFSLDDYTLKETGEFTGRSHDKITEEIYEKIK